MTTREEALECALDLPGTYEDAPFHDDNWVVVRRHGSRKIFLCTFERQGKIWLNVKVKKGWSQVLCASFDAIVPAYHMNKQCWVSMILDGSMDDGEIRRMIAESYDLVNGT